MPWLPWPDDLFAQYRSVGLPKQCLGSLFDHGRWRIPARSPDDLWLGNEADLNGFGSGTDLRPSQVAHAAWQLYSIESLVCQWTTRHLTCSNPLNTFLPAITPPRPIPYHGNIGTRCPSKHVRLAPSSRALLHFKLFRNSIPLDFDQSR